MKSQFIFDDLLQIRAPGVCFYVLRDEAGLSLIDGGFVGGLSSLERGLKFGGWENERILGVLVTHGHLDHILNVQKIAQASGAWIAASMEDESHYQGVPRYQGFSKLVGLAEAVGRTMFSFQPFRVEKVLRDGEFIDIWQGLQVVSLPGHTKGHLGFYCAARRLLFCGDIFASFGKFSHLPPSVFNVSSAQNRASIQKALELEVTGILPDHCDGSTPALHLQRLQRLHKKSGRL